jgi:hypothetical protein
MKSIQKLAVASAFVLSSVGALTISSCNKSEDAGCAIGYTGSDCKTPILVSFGLNNYKGNGSDNKQSIYTNWTLSVAPTSTTDLTKFDLIMKNSDGVVQFTFPATLTSNTSFKLDGTTSSGYTYTGNGTISDASMSVTISQKDDSGGGDDRTITFANMVK